MQLIDRDLISTIRRWHLSWLGGGTLLLLAASSLPATAQVRIVQEDFRDRVSYGWNIGGTFTPCLTADGSSPPGSIPNCALISDPPGQGVLRLTDNTRNQRGFVFYNYAIPANQGLVITFDYFTYGSIDPTRGSGADGITFFLLDGNTTTPEVGATGGALGYAQEVSNIATVNGLSNAYLGVGLDEFGNFANDYEGRGFGCPNQSPFGGGPGFSPPQAQIRDSVTLRGPGSGLTGYCYIANSGTLSTSPGGFSLDNPTATSRTAPNTRRRVRITLATNNTITLEIDPTGTGSGYRTIFSGVPAPPNRPDSFKLGFAASTGDRVNFHELVDLRVAAIEVPPLPDLAITKSDSGNFISGETGTYTLSVENLATATGPTYGVVRINDTLPEGFNFVSATGTNWNCFGEGQEVSCIYDGPTVNPGGSLPPLTLNVNVTAPPGQYINQATVSTEGDSDLTNNTAEESTRVGLVGDPNLLLVKRITSVTRDGVPLSSVDFSRFVDDPSDASDNVPGWTQFPPVGVYQLGVDRRLQSNDEVEYTVYFLSNGGSPVTNINICDLIPEGTTFVEDSLQVVNGTVPVEGNFFSPLVPLPAGNACSSPNNPNGAVIANLDNISNVAGSNFGLVRFRVRID